MPKDHKSANATKPVLLYQQPGTPSSVDDEDEDQDQQPEAEQQQQPQVVEPEKVLDFNNANDAYNHFWQQSDEWYDSLTKSEQDALKKYTGSGYHGINNALRDEGKHGTPLTAEQKAMEKHLNEGLAKFETKDTITLYRGAASNCIPKFAQKDPSKLIGKTYFDNAFMSCGASADKAWGGGTKFVITVPKGSKGAGAYVGHHSTCSHEGEFLLRSHSHFTVSNAYKDSSGKVVVEMTLIPGKYNKVSKTAKAST